MPRGEPAIKRVVSFVDGQNLFHQAKDSFGAAFPSYDVLQLSERICTQNSWHLTQARFYTGVPAIEDDAFWHHFWNRKAAAMGRAGVSVYTRPLRYRNKSVDLPGHGKFTFRTGEEKGIDVRLALDIIRLATQNIYDVALVFSQDQDLSEAVEEIKALSRQQDRWIRVASAFPCSPSSRNRRGINGSEWIKLDRALYDECSDVRDYRWKPSDPVDL